MPRLDADIPIPDAGVPDGFHWGVDSFTSIRSVFPRVMQQFGRAPDFWGRYITKGRSSVLRNDEITFLRDNSPATRLVLIHNPLGMGFFHQRVLDRNGKIVGFTPNPDNEFNRGQKAALDAISGARSVGIAIPRVLIYLNIEPDTEFPRIGRVSPNFIQGWWAGIGPQFGGIYGNVSEFIARDEQVGRGAVAFIGNAYNDARAGTTFQPFLWGQFPKKGRSFPVPRYQPKQPPGTTGAVRIWQYGPTSQRGGFDLNLATDEAFNLMIRVDSGAA
jgi:hypothetical protein